MRDHRFNRDSDHKGRCSKRKMIQERSDRHVCLICGEPVKKHEGVCYNCIMEREVMNDMNIQVSSTKAISI